MVSVASAGGGNGKYYLDLAGEDYYLSGGEPPGKWRGRGANKFGLIGTFKPEEFRHLLAGKSPDGTAELVQNAGAKNRRVGWDLTFSAPKSVSVLWSQTDLRTRQKLQHLHECAVTSALQFLEEKGAFTRRGKAGEELERTTLTVALFEHGTSRAQDPQLHTHAFVLNIGHRADGTTGALEGRFFMQFKMSLGAIYRAELSNLLQKDLGLACHPDREFFKIAGVPESLCDEFSKRRDQIEAALTKKGLSGAVAAKMAALDTREKKGHVARGVLFERWQEIGKAFGWHEQDTKNARRIEEFSRDALIREVLREVTHTENVFSELDIFRKAGVLAQGRGVGGAEAVMSVEKLIRSGELIELTQERGIRHFTSKEILRIEKDLDKAVARSKNSHASSFSSFESSLYALRERVKRKYTSDSKALSEEQMAALKHILCSRDGIRVVAGKAGTGKSHMLRAARELWERKGFSVIGLSVSGKAAEGLQESSGIRSRTVASFFKGIDRNRGIPRKKNVVVVDEAGMIGTRMMRRLVEVTQKSGAILVLVGDWKQIQPVEAGSPFKTLARRLGFAEMKEIQRQREEWARKAVGLFSEGKGDQALKAYAERGFVHVRRSRTEAMDRLISDWRKDETGIRDKIILASTNAEAKELNRLAQDERIKAGQLLGEFVKSNGEHFYQRDRIIFLENSKELGVKNGTLGVVSQVISNRLYGPILEVLLDDRVTKVQVRTRDFDRFQLGYAMTSHKAQGMTAENSYILAGGMMQDAEITYVQASRARGETRFYIDEQNAGPELKEISEQIKRSRQKEMATREYEQASLTPEHPFPIPNQQFQKGVSI